MAVELPKDYGFVVLVLVSYCIFNSWMTWQVIKARKRFKVPYPTLYAVESENKDAKSFNCVQRAHQNTLETMPVFFMLMMLGGIRYPLITAGFGLAYTVTRYFYFTGYASGDPKKRLIPVRLSVPALMGLMVCATSFGINLLRS